LDKYVIIVNNMSSSSIPKNEARFAAFFSSVSRGLKWVPPLNWLIVGNNDVPKGWQHIPESADTFGPWVTFPGDPEGSRLPIPRLYKRVGFVAVEKARLDTLQQEHTDAQLAIALKLGNAVVVGALAEGIAPMADPDYDNRLLMGTRISRGDLEMTAALWQPEERQLIVVKSSYARMMPMDEAQAFGAVT
jgi:hypothetical protein